MYLPLGSATRLRPGAGSTPDQLPPLPSSLAGLAKLGGAREEVGVDLCRTSDGELFALLAEDEVSVWSSRVS